MSNDSPSIPAADSTLTTELLILPDGRILVHNLTQPFAELLKALNPADEHISPRATDADSRFTQPALRSHEFPD
jgi:hypothetical protein